jgi:enamine deaminase RidA (YjgF/YER057c/UK114 family)
MTSASSPQASPFVTPLVIHEGIAYLSGQLPRENGEIRHPGKVGDTVSLEQAKAAARLCSKALVNVLQQYLPKGWQVERVLKITGFVACADGFVKQGAVIDGASEYLLEAFGANGAHARSAIGVANLPHGACVEVELTAAVSQLPT